MKIDEVSLVALRRITRALDVYSRTLLRQHSLTGPQLAILREVGRQGTFADRYVGQGQFSGPADRDGDRGSAGKSGLGIACADGGRPPAGTDSRSRRRAKSC